MNEQQFVALLKRAIQPGKIMIRLELDAAHALVLISTIQLALRHPNLPPRLKPLAREIVDVAIHAFPKSVQPELFKGYNQRRAAHRSRRALLRKRETPGDDNTHLVTLPRD